MIKPYFSDEPSNSPPEPWHLGLTDKPSKKKVAVAPAQPRAKRASKVKEPVVKAAASRTSSKPAHSSSSHLQPQDTPVSGAPPVQTDKAAKTLLPIELQPRNTPVSDAPTVQFDEAAETLLPLEPTDAADDVTWGNEDHYDDQGEPDEGSPDFDEPVDEYGTERQPSEHSPQQSMQASNKQHAIPTEPPAAKSDKNRSTRTPQKQPTLQTLWQAARAREPPRNEDRRRPNRTDPPDNNPDPPENNNGFPKLYLEDTARIIPYQPSLATLALSTIMNQGDAQSFAPRLERHYAFYQSCFDDLLFNRALHALRQLPQTPLNYFLRSATGGPAVPIQYYPDIMDSAIILCHRYNDTGWVQQERFDILQHVFAISAFINTNEAHRTGQLRAASIVAFNLYNDILQYRSPDEVRSDLIRVYHMYMCSLYATIVPLLLRRINIKRRPRKPPDPDARPPQPPPDDPGQPDFPPGGPKLPRSIPTANAPPSNSTRSSANPSSSRSKPVGTSRPKRPGIEADSIRIKKLAEPTKFVIRERWRPQRTAAYLTQPSSLRDAYQAADPDSSFTAPNGLMGHKLPENSFDIPETMEHAAEFNSPIGEAYPIPEDPSAYDFPEVQHTPGMPEGEYERWCELVQLFKIIFAVEIAKGGADLPEWVLHIKSGAIFNPMNYRRLAGLMAEALKERLEVLARMAVIIPVLAIYASNIVMAPQKCGYRMCVNYKPTNAETEDLKFPIPNLPDMLQFLKGKKVFTVLDNRLGYHQLRVHESAQRFLAFQCQFGIFTWLLCPMGPKTMPSWYTFLMTSIVFVGLMYTILVCYFDDCVIASDTFEQHYIDVKTVFQRMADRKLVLKGSKCQIARTSIKFLGYVITSNTIAHDPDRVKQVMKVEPPPTAHKLQMFLGLANYFHAFVRGYSVIRKPLNSMINDKPYRWNDERIAAFYNLRQAINDIPTLFHIDYNLSIYLDVDASQQGFFGYLFQLSTSHITGHPTVNQLTLDPDDMRFHQPLGFISHAFSGPQLKWNNTVREVFGITYCIIGFKSVLHTSHFYCRTITKIFLLCAVPTIPLSTIAWTSLFRTSSRSSSTAASDIASLT